MMRHSSRRGANAIEFALLLPLYVAITSGTMVFSWTFFQRSAVTTAAVDACREASLIDPGPEEEDIATLIAVGEQGIRDRLSQCDRSGEGCVYEVRVVHEAPYRTVECDVTLTVPMLISIPGMDNINLEKVHATGARRLEHQVH